uniref:Uncharacterized protein n=1 Tax=Arundo donax TaxID=35708 RepID=A0A0A9G7P3_ARUDO
MLSNRCDGSLMHLLPNDFSWNLDHCRFCVVSTSGL